MDQPENDFLCQKNTNKRNPLEMYQQPTTVSTIQYAYTIGAKTHMTFSVPSLISSYPCLTLWNPKGEEGGEK